MDDAANTAVGAAVTATDRQGGNMANAATGVGQQGTSGLGSGLSGTGNVATAAVDNAANSAALAGANMHNIGYGIGASFIDGMAAGAEANDSYLSGTLADIVRRGVAAAKGAAGISSPSKVFRDEVGLPIAQGIGAGLDAGQSGVLASADDLVNSTAALMARSVGGLHSNWSLTGVSDRLRGHHLHNGKVTSNGGSSDQTQVFSFNVNVSGVSDPAVARTVGEQVGKGAVDALTRRGVVTTARLG
jgi:hypothetical protein